MKDRIHTVEMNVIELVSKHCPDCPFVKVPEGFENLFDTYLCTAVFDKHCLAVVSTPDCRKHPIA